ncbi:hypothetical protein E0Z10_g9280 [Xylaria hypoxylon]|uniref:DUF6594 domain-containing protein n=1 Tax=Xylaria hypoxylon TaxID=37992 RepID=A0A4Z0YKV5_9PEZI|nr:hypothetical protein E0Z10_g9280 [Xylaria hypoxylon]
MSDSHANVLTTACSHTAQKAQEPRQRSIRSDLQTLLAAKAVTGNEDLNSIILRRFDTLALQNILSLHQKLSDLEGGDESWMKDIANINTRNALIKEYHESVLLYSKMLKLSEPPSGYVRDLNHVLQSKGVEDVWRVWHPEEKRPFTDLVAISPFDDPLTRFVAAGPLSIFFTGWIESFKRRQLLIKINVLRGVVAVIQFVVSLGFVVSALWSLWKLGNDIYTKLWVVTGFVVGFSIWVGLLTGLTKKESIAATAAYAAVLVVYVGSPGTGAGSGDTGFANIMVTEANITVGPN